MIVTSSLIFKRSILNFKYHLSFFDLNFCTFAVIFYPFFRLRDRATEETRSLVKGGIKMKIYLYRCTSIELATGSPALEIVLVVPIEVLAQAHPGVVGGRHSGFDAGQIAQGLAAVCDTVVGLQTMSTVLSQISDRRFFRKRFRKGHN